MKSDPTSSKVTEVEEKRGKETVALAEPEEV
jgi:hypothetical protein